MIASLPKTLRAYAAGFLTSALIFAWIPLAAAADETPAKAFAPSIAYYDSSQGVAGISQIPWSITSEVVLSFAGISPEGLCAWMDLSGNDAADLTDTLPVIAKALRAARDEQNPHTKLVLAVGGWTLSYRFSDATRDQEHTQQLAESSIAMMHTLNFDGIEYDWEYPTRVGKKNCPKDAVISGCASSNDTQQLTELTRATRALLGDGPDVVLDLALYASASAQDIVYDVAALDPLVTSLNIMTYDMAGPSWSPTSYHADFDKTKASISYLVAMGATKAKLRLGIPFYGYRWRGIADYAPGLYGPDGVKQTDDTLSWKKIQSTYGQDPGCGFVQNENGSYFYCPTGAHAGDWVSADSPRDVFRKAQWAAKEGLGGVMAWAVQGDTKINILNLAIFYGQNFTPENGNWLASLAGILPPDTSHSH